MSKIYRAFLLSLPIGILGFFGGMALLYAGFTPGSYQGAYLLAGPALFSIAVIGAVKAHGWLSAGSSKQARDSRQYLVFRLISFATLAGVFAIGLAFLSNTHLRANDPKTSLVSFFTQSSFLGLLLSGFIAIGIIVEYVTEKVKVILRNPDKIRNIEPLPESAKETTVSVVTKAFAADDALNQLVARYWKLIALVTVISYLLSLGASALKYYIGGPIQSFLDFAEQGLIYLSGLGALVTLYYVRLKLLERRNRNSAEK